MTNVKEIVKAYLKKKGFDGLCHDDCGCENSDLMPCLSENIGYCEAGYKHPCNCGEGCDWHIKSEPR